MDLALLVLALLLLAGCSGTPAALGAGDTGDVDVSGAWSGSYSTSLIPSATVTYTLTQNGTTVSGTYATSTGVAGMGTGTFSGTVDGNELQFTLDQTTPGCEGSFTGTATVTGSSMSLTFSGTDCLGVHGNGRGSAQRDP